MVLAFGLVLAAVVAHAAPASVVGSWVGKIKFDWSKVPAATQNKPGFAESKKKAESQIASFAVKIDVRKDGTYSAVTTGMPGKKDETELGKWTQSGDKVTFIDPKSSRQSFTISKDGKSLLGDFPSPGGVPAGMLKLVVNRTK